MAARILIAKVGLDGHDRGIKVVARILRDAGYEVIYTGLFQTPETVAAAAIDEDVDAIGLSMLSGAHLTLAPLVVQEVRRRGSEIPVIVGGIVPDHDLEALDRAGIAAVLTPGSTATEIVRRVAAVLPHRFTAVFWDFGGVILSSPFDAFEDYERAHGLPVGFIRSVNAVDPNANAWAQIERRTISAAEFDTAFADESERLGHRVGGADILGLLHGRLRPEMVVALDRVIDAGFTTACLTNNVASDAPPEVAAVLARFDHVIESSVIGVRKPDADFYEIACATAGVTPDEVVFLDDLGINLKPARAMGMTTIKVESAEQAIRDLGAALGLDLASPDLRSESA